jgi:iron-sulfur cluster repair protein YtfE (RIC family)
MLSMTIITTDITTAPLQLVVHDLYRDIHKGIRAELFCITERAGNLDPADRSDRADLSARVHRVVELLVSHAEHEDGHIQPVLERHLPDLATQIEDDHERLEARIELLAEQAADLVDAGGNARWRGHQLYVELASFTSSYLAHQDLEERVVMPSLETVVGPEGSLALHQAIVGSIAPADLATSLSVMLPAMNVDDRAELLGGMQAGAPAEVFQGIWGLAASVLEAHDVDAVAARLGL